MKISHSANSGAFTFAKMLINVHCPFSKIRIEPPARIDNVSDSSMKHISLSSPSLVLVLMRSRMSQEGNRAAVSDPDPSHWFQCHAVLHVAV